MKDKSKKAEDVRDEDYYSREISSGSFAKTIALPEEVDSEKATLQKRHT